MMDELIEIYQLRAPSIVMIVGLIAVWWRCPSKQDIEKATDILLADLTKLTDKMDSHTQAIHNEMRKLADKLDTHTQATHERIDKATAELRADTKTMDQNYIDPLARHEEQVLKARESQGD